MLSGTFRWLASLTEVAVAVLAILFSGLVIGMSAFWFLSHVVDKLSGHTPEVDSSEQEKEEDLHANVISIRPDDGSRPSQPRV
jgi:hypothetical protein